jgi:hypothetical protein
MCGTTCRDADKIPQLFYEACSQAGPDSCALFAPDPAAIKARVDALFASLKVKPIVVPVTSNATDGPLDYGLLDYNVVRRSFGNYFYNPFTNASAMAAALAAAEQGDGRPFWELVPVLDVIEQCASGAGTQNALETLAAIACTDGDPVSDSLEDLNIWYEQLAATSSFADLLYVHVACAYVNLRSLSGDEY